MTNGMISLSFHAQSISETPWSRSTLASEVERRPSRCIRKSAATPKSYAKGPPHSWTATIGMWLAMAVHSSSSTYGRLYTPAVCTSTSTCDAITHACSWLRLRRSSESRKTGALSLLSSSPLMKRASIAASIL